MDPASPIAVVGVFALIVFNIVVGWKAYSLSRKPVGSLEEGRNGGRAEGGSGSMKPIYAVGRKEINGE